MKTPTPITNSMRRATLSAIERIAQATARQATGQRKRDAQEHCRRLGIPVPE
jgi:hypothetical protein